MNPRQQPRQGLSGAIAAKAVAAAAAAVTILTFSTVATAQDDEVLAIVNGTEILRSAVIAEISTLPPQFQQIPPAQLLPQLLDRMIDNQLLQDKALDAGMAADPEVVEQMQRLEARIAQQVFLGRLIDEAATEEAVLARYEASIADFVTTEEVSARHILLESEDDARAAIVELDGGADFATLAQERSTGPSGPSGGDLGFFEHGRMVPEFADAAFDMTVGTYTADPVQTQFGWHVILVEDRREVGPPSLEETSEEIRNSLVQEFMTQYVGALRADAEIELVGAAAAQ